MDKEKKHDFTHMFDGVEKLEPLPDMEKKLTDEEIVKDIERSTGMPSYWKKIVLDLIHRLQDENKRLKEEKEEIRLFNLAIQNGEIDMRIESEIILLFDY